MDNYINFINNLRAGLAEADRQAGNFINQAGNELGKAWNAGTAPLQAIGNNIGQAFNQTGQMVGQGLNQTSQMLGQGLGQLFNTIQAPTQAQPTTQNAQLASNVTPITNTQQQAQQVNPNMTYYVRDPAIDGFVNTLRFMMNPIRGITGWTPLDMVANTMSDSMYNTFGKKYTPTTEVETKTEDKKPDSTETTKPVTEAVLTSADDSDVVTYTYKPGDTFGQVILDLGLGTANGLWGVNGDVDYYTKQLIDQGIWNDGIARNIPIGTTIKLRRRK